MLEQNIENMIYEIRGKQVMLSSDIAKLYKVETKVLNQTIKRNIKRFPNSFCFQLNENEIDELSLRSQFVTLNKSNNLRGQHYKYLPYVLTEEGIMMLSGLLKSDIAVKVNIRIVDAFVKMRKYIKFNLLEQQYINSLVLEHDESIKLLNEAFDKLEEKELKNKLILNGELFDSYLEIIKILNKAKKEIIIIDNYADTTLLEIISKINKQVILITNKRILKDIDINKYNSQYNNLRVIENNSFHDRFIILDMNKIYHIGSSINHLGNKISTINIIEEEIVKNALLDNIKTFIMI